MTVPPAPGAKTSQFSGRGLVVALCLAEVLGMTATMTFPALLPGFLAEWRLSNTAAGWINGVFYGGYAAAVAVLSSLTDRVDPKRIYLACTALAGVSALGFALLAGGFWSAMALRALGGVALAGTYMPGLRILSDHLSGPRASRLFAFYTASFAIGSGVSVLLAGQVAGWLDWRWAFAISAVGPAMAFAVALVAAPATPRPATPATGALLDFRPVFANRPAMGYVLGYTAHSWELFGFRSWLVAFLAFGAGLGAADDPTGITRIATVILLLGVPASILGNEAAVRFGRRGVLTAVMLASAAVGCTIGYLPELPFVWLVVLVGLYGVLVMGDSAALTIGAVGAADPALKGATLAVHAMLGFAGAFLGPLAFGVVLDLAGGPGASGWGPAFFSLGAVVALGPLALWLTRARRDRPVAPPGPDAGTPRHTPR